MQETSLARSEALGLGAAAAALLALALAGCDGAGAQERRVLTAEDLPGQSLDAERCVWQSAPWTGQDWLSYPGRVTLEIPHGAGACATASEPPADVSVYLSFDRRGGFATLGAGDPVVVESVSTARVALRNNTNQDYFIRVVVR